MTVSAAKPEEKRLGWFVPTAVDQAESCVKPAAEGRNLARMPNPQHSETERLDHGPNWLKHTEDGLLLGECRSKLLSPYKAGIICAYSGVIRPPVPMASGHPFRFDPSGDSGVSGHPQIHLV